jgi:hypothetical protein
VTASSNGIFCCHDRAELDGHLPDCPRMDPRLNGNSFGSKHDGPATLEEQLRWSRRNEETYKARLAETIAERDRYRSALEVIAESDKWTLSQCVAREALKNG